MAMVTSYKVFIYTQLTGQEENIPLNSINKLTGEVEYMKKIVGIFYLFCEM